MSSPDNTAGTSFRGVTPYLYYSEADDALAWLTRVLGFGPAARWTDDSGTLLEAEIAVGDQPIAIGARAPGPNEGGGQTLIVHVDDVDAHYRDVTTALSSDDQHIEPPQDQPYGPRSFHITDPWGYRWYFWQGQTIPPNG